MVDIWREEANVRFESVDRSDRITLGSIFSFFQEAAISHAADLGVGRDVMKHSGQAWVLSRLSLFVQRRPVCGERIKINTWPRSWEKLFALRDYEIRDSNDIPVVRGRSGWLVLDIEKRRPLRAQPVVEGLPPNEGINAFAFPVGLNARENLVKTGERSALYSDIDYYGHMNNARYIQWIQDMTDSDILTNAEQLRLDINYLGEIKPGDKLELWTAPLENTPEDANPTDFNPTDYPAKAGPGFAYEGRGISSGQVMFRAELRSGTSQ